MVTIVSAGVNNALVNVEININFNYFRSTLMFSS